MYKDSSKCFLTSHLDFCNRQVCGLPNNQLHKQQRIQNAAARLICNVGRFEHITPHHCTGSIGYPLTIESSLKSFHLYIKPSTVSLPLIYLNLQNLKQPQDIISETLMIRFYSLILLLRVVSNQVTAHLNMQGLNCGTSY